MCIRDRADVTTDPIERQRLLTFAVAGGGFAGTETVAELFDLAHSTLRYYPRVPIGELRFVLVHSGQRILPEIGPELADYALEKLRGRGIEFHLGVRVASATADTLTLNDGTAIHNDTFVWTAGNRPNPLLAGLKCEHGGNGGIIAQPTMAVEGLDGVWALGDNASIPDPFSEDGYYPPTAQHALRQGKVLADNIVATVTGRPPKSFKFKAIGILVALGHRTAVAEVRGIRFSGIVAWLFWRSVYLSKLPGLEQKARVLFDWTLDLFFPRDITLTDNAIIETPPAKPPTESPKKFPTESNVR